MWAFVSKLIASAWAIQPQAQVGIECTKIEPGDSNIVLKYNFFASEFGYYEIEGCQGVSPHLILASGQEYTFIQSHISNWNHPLGFAYYPDGEDRRNIVTAVEHDKNNMRGSTTIDHQEHDMGGITTTMNDLQHNMGITDRSKHNMDETTSMDHSKHNMRGTTSRTMDSTNHNMGETDNSNHNMGEMDNSNHNMTAMVRNKRDVGRTYTNKHDTSGTTTMDSSKHNMGAMDDCSEDHSGHHIHHAGSVLGPTACRNGNDACVNSRSCDTPIYGIDNERICESVYFDAFSRPIERWYGDRDDIPGYRVRLQINQDTTDELFYFCHFHSKINGKITICDRQDNGECKKRVYDPHLLEYDAPAAFDAKCGTANIHEFAKATGKGGKCEGLEFLCGVQDQLSECFEATDCAMNHAMRVHYTGAAGRVDVFMQQMIPHHQNAVNMAKIVLNDKECRASDNEEFENLLRTIVNEQNRQIQYMQAYLENANAHSVDKAHCALPTARTGAEGFTNGNKTQDDPELVHDAPCEILPSNKSYTEVFFSFDYFASEYGHFSVKGCKGVSPTLVLASDHEYRFIQRDITNFYHPLAFSYDPDGKTELKPDIDPSGSGCNPDCQHARYYMDDQFLGGTSSDKRGIEKYKQDFTPPQIDEWSGGGTSSKHNWHVRLRITDGETAEVIYFDSLLREVGGRIKICDWDAEGQKCSPRRHATKHSGYFMDTPVQLAPRHIPSLYDRSCGTSNLSPFQPGNGYDKFCKGNVFMCSDEGNYDHFASCFDALNCAMHDQMRVEHTGNCQELFINQMIPHHQHAVNMAKTMFKFAGAELTSGRFAIPCAHDQNALCPDLDMLGLFHSIVSQQNAQIQFMRDYLATSTKVTRKSPSFCESRDSVAVTEAAASDAQRIDVMLIVMAVAMSFMITLAAVLFVINILLG